MKRPSGRLTVLVVPRRTPAAESEAIHERNEEIPSLESDPKMFEDRFARCHRLLDFLAARILGSQDEAEGAVRNCRAAASRNPPGFESEGAFRSWLARILIDEACALLRRKQFPLVRSLKSLRTNPEGSSGYRLYGVNDAYTLGISDCFRRTR